MPGDEELAAVMAALSGISEDESYDAMLASFDADGGVDPAVAADLERKRRETFRRMMEEAEREREAEKRAAEKRRAETADGERMLEDRISAAVEAAVRAKEDPGKALDEAFPELAASDDEKGTGNFSAEMLEMIDFEEPREDGAAWTDHSLEEFTARRGEPETDKPEEESADGTAENGPEKED